MTNRRKRFRAEWLERFKGVFKSHGIATTGGDISIQKVAESMKDMDMVNGQNLHPQRDTRAFRRPP